MSFVITSSGRYFFFDSRMYDSVVNIHDIAVSLSRLPRFTGHTIEDMTVAEHSVLVSKMVPQEYALIALLHDAHEAYIGDINTPFKRSVPGLKEIELRVQRCVLHKLGVIDVTEMADGADPIPEVVHAADYQAMQVEAFTNMHQEITKHIGPPPSFAQGPKFMDKKAAHIAFLQRYADLMYTNARARR